MKKLGLIGCGGIGEYHLSHFLKYDFVEVVAFCDLIEERAQNFAKTYKSGNVYTDYKEMYEKEELDMVFICIPPYCHGELELETIKRGIHFFVEKPVSLDYDMAKKIREEVEKNNIITAVGFQCRYDNINEAAKEYLANNKIVTINASRVGGIPEVEWWRNKELSGGQLVEQAIHQLDILRYLCGDITEVYTVNQTGFADVSDFPGYDTDDLSLSIFKFENGVTCSFMCACYSQSGHSWESKMTFGSAKTRMDYNLCAKVTVYGGEEKASTETVKGDGTQGNIEGDGNITKSNVDFGLICDETFIKAVINNDPSAIKTNYAEGLKSVAVGLATNESIKTGMPVKVRND